MKKILSIILAASIILSCITVFAKSDISLDFLTNIPSSFEASGKLSMKLNKPLKFLDIDYIKGDDFKYIVFQDLAESLTKADVKMDIKMLTDEDNILKTYCAFDIKTPFVLNDCLNGNANAKMFTWSTIDTTDGYNSTSIVKSPTNTKYVITKSELPEDIALLIKQLLPNSLGFKFASVEIVKAIKENSTISKKGNVVYLNISNEQVKGLLNELVKAISHIPALNENIDVEEASKYIDNLDIFADKAIEYKYTLKGDKISKVQSAINIKTNMYDLVSNFGITPTKIDHENSDIDIKLSCELTYKYNKVKIDFPVLTDENSIDTSIPEFDQHYYDECYDDEYYDDGFSYYLFSYNVNTEDEFKEVISTGYFDVEKLAEAFYGFDEEEYIVKKENNKIFVKSDYNYTEFEVVANSNQVIVNGNIIELDKPAIIRNGNIFVSSDFISKIFQAKQSSSIFNYSYDENTESGGQFEFVIPCYE